MTDTSETIPLGRYLWSRIHQLGVSSIFGVPGDFQLQLLDHIYPIPGLSFVPNTNELNAAYAADGYARANNGFGCVVTTHGVGELSALNAIAGSMTEQVKVIHVVGQTPRMWQEQRLMIHHSIGTRPDHAVFGRASREFRMGAAELWDDGTAVEEIDRVLREGWVKGGPVYVFLPLDMAGVLVPAERLKTPIDLEPEVDGGNVESAAKAVLEEIYKSRRPAVFVDALVNRHDAAEEARELVERLDVLVFTSNMAKGTIDETHPRYVGIANGVASTRTVAAAFEDCNLVLVLGDLPADTNTGGFTRQVKKDRGIYINPHDISILDKHTFAKTPLKKVLQAINTNIDPSKVPKVSIPAISPPPPEEDHNSHLITQSWIWHHLANTFFQPSDTILGDTGTASFGIPDATFPPDVTWITQTYYGSIGYATPAAFGVEIHRAEEHHPPTSNRRKRTVLITGDGSLMLTVQELANFVKHDLCPVVFIINNAGYTIERVIHGAHQGYNDIVPFNYAHLLPFFNMPEAEAKKCFHRCTTRTELEEVLAMESVRRPQKMQIVEVVMDKLDVPWRLSVQLAARGKEQIAKMEEAGFKVTKPAGTNGEE